MFDPGVIYPALVTTLAIWFIWWVFRKISRAFWKVLGWMVVNGYYFPKMMREQRDAHITQIENDMKKLDHIINNRSIK